MNGTFIYVYNAISNSWNILGVEYNELFSHFPQSEKPKLKKISSLDEDEKRDVKKKEIEAMQPALEAVVRPSSPLKVCEALSMVWLEICGLG